MSRPKGSKNRKTLEKPLPVKPVITNPRDKPNKKTDNFESAMRCKIARFIPGREYPSILRDKKDFLILDQEGFLYLIKPDSSYYQELKDRQQAR